jgi:hypothetical protein
MQDLADWGEEEKVVKKKRDDHDVVGDVKNMTSLKENKSHHLKPPAKAMKHEKINKVKNGQGGKVPGHRSGMKEGKFMMDKQQK